MSALEIIEIIVGVCFIWLLWLTFIVWTVVMHEVKPLRRNKVLVTEKKKSW